jgi:hypothetical protein
MAPPAQEDFTRLPFKCLWLFLKLKALLEGQSCHIKTFKRMGSRPINNMVSKVSTTSQDDYC